MTWIWDDRHVVAMDYETSGVRPEYALQPWRIPRGDTWVTSMAWVWPYAGQLMSDGAIKPLAEVTEQFLLRAVIDKLVVCTWNAAFDISVAMALGYTDLCHHVRWLDGMLLWRHLDIEPERDEDGPKKSYGLKAYVREKLPEAAGYEEDVNFHVDSPEALVKLHEYNVADCALTLRACKDLWGALTERQRQAAWIEASCLPMVAEANLTGLLIDTIAAQDLMLQLKAKAAAKLAELAPYGVTEAIVRSPKQMATLLYETWGLPKQGQTSTGAPSTDKNALFELAIIDPRAKQIRDYREALNCSKKFAETPWRAANYNGDQRAHPLARVFGAYSSRFTYSSKQTQRKKGVIDDESA